MGETFPTMLTVSFPSTSAGEASSRDSRVARIAVTRLSAFRGSFRIFRARALSGAFRRDKCLENRICFSHRKDNRGKLGCRPQRTHIANSFLLSCRRVRGEELQKVGLVRSFIAARAAIGLSIALKCRGCVTSPSQPDGRP
jgi:hypothetical protein